MSDWAEKIWRIRGIGQTIIYHLYHYSAREAYNPAHFTMNQSSDWNDQFTKALQRDKKLDTIWL